MRDLAERIWRGRQAVSLAKRRGLDVTEWQARLDELLAQAGPGDGVEPWMLWEWRRISIPEWRRILVESTDKGDNRRAEYARWMLRDVLLDPEYKEPQP